MRYSHRMDAQQRQRAGKAVAAAMDTQGLSPQQLAKMSGVAVVTVRDLCSGKRWPWTSKRNAIELALGWEIGRIAQVAKGNVTELQVAHGVSECVDPTHGLSVRDALAAVLEASELSPARQAKVVAYYLELVEDQAGTEGSTRRSTAL